MERPTNAGNGGAPPAAGSAVSQALQTGIRLHREGQLRQAEAAYSEALRLDPGNPDALHLRGLIAFQIGRPQEAAELAREAIQRNPKSPPYKNTLGLALTATGDLAGAARAFEAALALDPRYAEAHVNAGNLLRRQGKAEGALGHYRQALAAQPNNGPAACLLGNLLTQRGEPEAALAHLELAAKLRPDDPEVLTCLGAALAALGRPAAKEPLEKALQIKVDHVDAYKVLAHLYSAAGGTREAVKYLRRASAFAPKDAELKADLGHVLISAERYDEAKEALEAALALAPKTLGALIGLSRLARISGDLAEALARAEATLAIDPDFAPALCALIDLDRGRLTDGQWTRMERLAQDPRVDAEDRIRFNFALARRRESGAAAFRHLVAANELQRKDLARRGRTFDPAAVVAVVDHVIRVFDGDYFGRAKGHGSNSERPVFIVGMPRSGTTLCEHILASHSMVHGAGELRDMAAIAAKILAEAAAAVPSAATPEAALAQSPEIIWRGAERYLQHLTALTQSALRVTDKMPDNFMRLGIIATLFPRARVVHCRRDPMDTCFSCYEQTFGPDVPWAWDLVSIGQYYRQYERLMAHWRAVLPMPMHELTYEEMVAEPERTTRALVEFCELPWEDACLEFQTTQRPVQTASSLQVRRPIYADSVGKWRAYAAELEPLRKALEGDA